VRVALHAESVTVARGRRTVLSGVELSVLLLARLRLRQSA
jgi:hypothetical protein